MSTQNNNVKSEVCAEVINNYNTTNPLNPQPIFKKVCYNLNTNLLIPNNSPNYSIANTVTDQNILQTTAMRSGNTGVFSELINNPSGFNPTDPQQSSSSFNKILQETPIKIACCNRKTNDNGPYFPLVRVASNNNFGFNLQTINVPAKSCPVDLYPDSPKCNAFYDVYCENVFNVFKSTNLPQEQLINYAPECACYIPKTSDQMVYPISTPSACYKPGCNLQTSAYLDTISRNKPCNLTVCQNIVSATNIQAGGQVSINPTAQNNCGAYVPQGNSVTTTDITSLNRFTDTTTPSSDNLFSTTNSTQIIIAIVIILLCCCCSCCLKK